MKDIKNIKLKVIIGLIAIAFILVANLHYAFLEYGILSANTLHVNVLAQGSGSTTSGGNSGSSGNSGNSGNSSSETKCPDYNYVPDRYIDSQIIETDVTSNTRGELVIDGVIKAGYQKNRTYTIVIEKMHCNTYAEGACCDQRKVTSKVLVR